MLRPNRGLGPPSTPTQMKTLTILLILVVLHATEACAQSLRVATYNLNWANRRGDEVLDAIATANPDLICFQESTVQSERFLRDSLSKTYPYFHSVGHDGRYAAERFTFASKTELKQLDFVPPNAGLFGFYSATLKLDDATIRVVNVHLSPFQIRRGGGIADAMVALSTTEDTHSTEIAAVVNAVDLQRPTIILGDFNSLSTFNAPQRLAQLGLVDAYASVHKDADTHPTWHWPTRPLPLALRIDYIFHTHHFVATEAAVIRREGSDHSLVFAELTFGEQSHATEPAAGSVSSGKPSAPAR